MAVYVYVSPFLPGDFQTRWVSPQRMVAYVGLDVNGMIGSILAVAVLVVIPFTILGQVLAQLHKGSGVGFRRECDRRRLAMAGCHALCNHGSHAT